MNKNINDYRTSMITAIDIILGFVLACIGQWATKPTGANRSTLWVAIGILIGIVLLIIALYRILDRRVPAERKATHYQRTLKTFMIGIMRSFIGTLGSIFQQMFL